jgi:phage host-nuclease inhibitor protein Gam
MAKKKKTQSNIITISTWNEADEMLRRIGDIILEINQHESTAKADIDEANAALAKATTPLQTEKDQLFESLEDFATNHRTELNGAQSRELHFGKLGWRKSSSIHTKADTLKLIEDVYGKKSSQYLTIKKTVNKDALKLLTDKELASVKAQRKPKEEFYAEPTLPSAVDYADKKP